MWGWVDGWTGDLLIQSSSFLFSLRLFWKGELLNCDLLASGASQFSIFGLLSPHWLPTHPHPLLREKERDPLHLLVFLANPQRDVWGLSHRRRRLFPLFLFSFLCAWLQVLEESLESAKQLVSVSSISRHIQRNRAQPLSPTWLTHHNPHREEDDSRNKKKKKNLFFFFLTFRVWWMYKLTYLKQLLTSIRTCYYLFFCYWNLYSRFQRVLLDIRPQISSGAPLTAGLEIQRISPVFI